MSIFTALTTGGGTNAVGTIFPAFRIGLTGPTIYNGSADPTLTPPTPMDDGFHDGDLYIRASAGASTLWVFDTVAWSQIASGAVGGSFSSDILMNPGAKFLGDDSATAASPAYSFDGDPDTGIFQNNPNEISFSTNGLERFIIESDGTLSSTTAGYESLVLSDNDIPNRKYVEDGFINSAGDTMTGPLSFGAGIQLLSDDGTVLIPGISFGNDTNTGYFLDTGTGIDTIGITAGGVIIANWDPTGLVMRDTSQIFAITGNVGAPGYSWVGDDDTGFYQPATGTYAFTANGVEVIRYSATTANGSLLWQGGDGSAATPAISFSGDTDNGMFRVGANDIGIATGGTEALGLDDTTISVGAGRVLQIRDGAVGSPGLQFGDDPNVGIFRSAADTMNFATDGIDQFEINATGDISINNGSLSIPLGQILAKTGSTALPGYSFVGDPDSGMYSPSIGNVAFAIDGVERVRITSTDVRFDQQVRVDETNQSVGGPAFSFGGDFDTGLYSGGANIVGLSTGGVGRWIVNAAGDMLPVANNVYDIGSSSFRANTVFATTFDGTATAARYSDLAERYSVGDCCNLKSGDVVVICDHEDHDICIAGREEDIRVLGVVSTQPGFMMNKDAGDDDTAPYIALRGRVPVKVCGDIKKGDLLITCGKSGCARSVGNMEQNTISPHAVFAKALSSDVDGYCEAVIL